MVRAFKQDIAFRRAWAAATALIDVLGIAIRQAMTPILRRRDRGGVV